MQTKVVKFGGSSLADAAQFRKVAAIIKAEPERRYVVASAPGKRFSDDIKVTDMLYDCFDLAAKKQNIDEAFAKIEARYNGIIADLGLDFSLDKEFRKIRMAIEHHAGQDYVASRGEYLNSMILAKFLGFTFVDAESGIFFHSDGSFDDKQTYKALSALLEDVEYAVIPGFYGSMPNGTIKTFSRGGSDNWTGIAVEYEAETVSTGTRIVIEVTDTAAYPRTSATVMVSVGQSADGETEYTFAFVNPANWDTLGAKIFGSDNTGTTTTIRA